MKQNTEAFQFDSLTEGQKIGVEVSATGGGLMEDDTWIDTLEFVGKQNLSAQSRKESYEFKRVEDGGKVFLRFSAEHKNNFGFTMSQRDTSHVDYDAMWQDPIRDDREWTVENIDA